MGLEAELRNYTPCLSVDQAICDRRTVDRAADALAKLRGYAVHDDGCTTYLMNVHGQHLGCSCGLTDLLKEIGE